MYLHVICIQLTVYRVANHIKHERQLNGYNDQNRAKIKLFSLLVQLVLTIVHCLTTGVVHPKSVFTSVFGLSDS